MDSRVTRVLVANRGEIAVRVCRACRELEIGAVAVFEPPDRGALHTEAADSAVAIESYLDGPGLVDAALAAGADAVHPGYGFLAENAEFAELVQRAGLTWIGPPPEAMRSLGDKVEARRLAEAAGLRVVPGYAGIDLSDATLTREAERLGAPVVVKAAAGGGGRGMRAVSDLVEMPDALAAARREAAAAFGDDRVFVEREMPDVRHVEVQLLADAHGTVLHLGERDCSVQRRHQKVIEESPSPAVDPALRAELGEAAVALGRAAGYVGAGTVEFLLDSEGGWYFLELNARLQVEHPVTEAVTGIDLVRAQIEIAGGTPLLTEQDEVVLRGHAIQCRLYAEDPAREFLPATGRLERFDVPAWPGGRTDTGVRQGDLVGVRYDPLLAKVIAHAEDRDACLDRISAMLARDGGAGRRDQPRLLAPHHRRPGVPVRRGRHRLRGAALELRPDPGAPGWCGVRPRPAMSGRSTATARRCRECGRPAASPSTAGSDTGSEPRMRARSPWPPREARFRRRCPASSCGWRSRSATSSSRASRWSSSRR